MRITAQKIIFVLILLLASLLRLYSLGEYPALNADEAAIGYNAYSLIETGKDEHGHSWPIHFQSFNDYKPGGYFYMALPFVYLFGLNVWSVRIVGAFFGILSVVIVFLLSREITKDNKTALFSAFLLAISPWHIHFSRGGWEVNVATFFITLGVYLFLKGVKDAKYFALAMIAFVISLYTYHAARVLVPLIGFGLLVIYRKQLLYRDNLKLFLGSILFAVVLLIPLSADFIGEAGSARASGVSIFADRGYIDRINEKRGRYENPNSLFAKLAHNKPKEIVIEFSKNYFEHFSGEFLFVSGDRIQRNKVPETGQLYFFQIPLLVISLIAISRKKSNWWVMIVWLLIAPIPAALTFQSPHALRAQNMIVPLTIISAYGMTTLSSFLNTFNIKNLLAVSYILIGGIISWEAYRYIHQYYVHMAKAYPYSSQYGVKEMSEYVSENNDSYDKVVITTRYDQPYILYLFYSKYPPQMFQNNHNLTPKDQFGFSTVATFDKFVFKEINYQTDQSDYNNALIFGTDEEIPEGTSVVKEIYGTNEFLYFQGVKN